MAKTPTSELFATLKGYINQLTEGDQSPNEVASALNGWARESAESIKAKIAEEVEVQVSKMGFIKRAEYEKLAARVEKIEKSQSTRSATRSATKKSTVKKAMPAGNATKARSPKKAASKKGSK